MKRICCYLFMLLLCLGALLLPAAAESEEAPPEQTVSEQEIDPAPSPYSDAKEGVYSSEEAKNAALAQWKKSGMRNYYFWSRGGAKQRPKYSRSFRQYYANDPLLTIVDHMVLMRCQYTDYKGRPSGNPYYQLLDYFDTDEAEQNTTTLRIPAKVDDLPVTLFLYRTVKHSNARLDSGYTNSTVKKVIFAQGVSNIGAYAFANFKALKTVSLSDTVESIGVFAFENCTSLTKVTGGKALREVQFAAFRGCKKLSSFAPMATLRFIWGEAFAGCGFRSLLLNPNAATCYSDNIDLYQRRDSFADCKKLRVVSFTDTDQGNWFFIGAGAFRNCTALQTVSLQYKCRYLDDNAFAGCTKLTTLQNTKWLYGIREGVFRDCVSLKSFVLPKKCTTFSADLFTGCTGLKKLVIQEGNNAKLFSESYRPEKNFSYEVACNFFPYLPDSCTVVVYSEEMKEIVRAREFGGAIRVHASAA